jgi:hypothetical protein
MNLKRLTLTATALFMGFALAITGCKKDDGSTKKDDNGGGTTVDPDAPVVSLRSSFPGDLYWVWENKIWPVGNKVRFGVEVKCPTEIAKVEVFRKTISGPNAGTEIVIWDTTLNETITNKTQIKELLTDGVVATQTVIFIFKATAKNGKTGQAQIQISPDVAIGERQDQTVWNRNENGAYDLREAVSLNLDQAPARHDIKLAKTGNDFRFTSGNNSKFKPYNGTRFFPGFNNTANLTQAWNESGPELTQTPILSEDATDYKLILVKSNQNNSVYVISIYEVNTDHVVFDVRGEGI